MRRKAGELRLEDLNFRVEGLGFRDHCKKGVLKDLVGCFPHSVTVEGEYKALNSSRIIYRLLPYGWRYPSKKGVSNVLVILTHKG